MRLDPDSTRPAFTNPSDGPKKDFGAPPLRPPVDEFEHISEWADYKFGAAVGAVLDVRPTEQPRRWKVETGVRGVFDAYWLEDGSVYFVKEGQNV